MQTVKSMDVREHFKEWCNKVISGETLIVSRPRNENIVILSEKEYHEMAKAKRYIEYLTLLSKHRNEQRTDKTITFTMDELKDMEAADWIPPQKVIDFMESLTNE